ncbi:hypothetical protein [Streptomyces altiplanensis]
MSTARSRALDPGPDVLEPAVRDPRALTAAERAATGDWTVEPAPGLQEFRPGRRRFGGGRADSGRWPSPVSPET